MALPGLHRKFDIDTVPTTVIVDEQGTVVAGWVGRIDLSEFDRFSKLFSLSPTWQWEDALRFRKWNPMLFRFHPVRVSTVLLARLKLSLYQ